MDTANTDANQTPPDPHKVTKETPSIVDEVSLSISFKDEQKEPEALGKIGQVLILLIYVGALLVTIGAILFFLQKPG